MPHGQWALLDADMLVLIDGQHVWWSCTCVWHTPLTVSVVRFHREVFAPHSPLALALSLRLRDLDLLLDDLSISLHCFSTLQVGLLTRCWVLS